MATASKLQGPGQEVPVQHLVSVETVNQSNSNAILSEDGLETCSHQGSTPLQKLSAKSSSADSGLDEKTAQQDDTNTNTSSVETGVKRKIALRKAASSSSLPTNLVKKSGETKNEKKPKYLIRNFSRPELRRQPTDAISYEPNPARFRKPSVEAMTVIDEDETRVSTLCTDQDDAK